LPLQSGIVLAWLGTCHDQGSGSAETVSGFAAASDGKHAAAKGIQSIDQDNIVLARQTQVLETVVEQKDARREALLHLQTHIMTISPDSDVGISSMQEHLGFIAGQIQAGDLAARDQDDRLGGFALVTASEDGGVAASLTQTRRQMRHHRRFADTAHRQAADADYGSFE
jgi:hypothetical protein